MRILSIDPAIRHTGYAVIEGDHKTQKALDYGVITLPQKVKQSLCLRAIHEHVVHLIERWQPDEFAIERIIFVQSRETAIYMGSARAAAVIAAAAHELPIVEYSPTSVKLAVVGRGGAGKEQVAFMMRVLLKLTETPQPDAADALAIGFAHLASSDPLKARVVDRRYI